MNKRIILNILMFIVFIVSIYISYGYGLKENHVRYAKAYYEPTVKLLYHFDELVQFKQTEVLLGERQSLNAQLSNIHWRDEFSYFQLVDKIIYLHNSK